MEKYDVVIVGAGPSGLETAVEASNRGVDVLLIEKDPIGTAKRTWNTFYTTIENFDLKNIAYPITDEIFSSSRILWHMNHHKPKIKYIVAQEKFTEEMIKRGDFDVLDETMVEGVENDHFVKLKTSNGDIKAKLVVDATGAASSVSKMFGIDRGFANSGHACYGIRLKNFTYDDIDLRNPHNQKQIETNPHTIFHNEIQIRIKKPFFDGLNPIPRRWTPSELFFYPIDENTMDVGYGFFIFKKQYYEWMPKVKKIGEKAFLKKLIFPMLNDRLKYVGYDISEHMENIECEYYGFGNPTIVSKPFAKNLIITGESAGRIEQNYLIGLERGLEYGKVSGEFTADYIHSLLLSSSAAGKSKKGKIKISDYAERVRKADVRLSLGYNVKLNAMLRDPLFMSLYLMFGDILNDAMLSGMRRWEELFAGGFPGRKPKKGLNGKEMRLIDGYVQRDMDPWMLVSFLLVMLPNTLDGLLYEFEGKLHGHKVWFETEEEATKKKKKEVKKWHY
jgi:flavin-dependent dehydrogenase